jgi:hypothetical protein
MGLVETIDERVGARAGGGIAARRRPQMKEFRQAPVLPN